MFLNIVLLSNAWRIFVFNLKIDLSVGYFYKLN